MPKKLCSCNPKQEDYEKFMRMAIEESIISVKEGQTPFGAVIVKDGKIIAKAHNSVYKTSDPTAHAEMNAIRIASSKAGINLKGAILFSSCEPCPMCFSASHWAKISEIVYGATIDDARKLGFREISIYNKDFLSKGSSIKIIPGLLRKEAVKAMKKWKGRPY
ncbi:MAG: nucleoside deaminase [Candidatus Anstonellales archaeon]